jgi:RNA polymerase sigma-70 factor (ECF subfamily)
MRCALTGAGQDQVTTPNANDFAAPVVCVGAMIAMIAFSGARAWEATLGLQAADRSELFVELAGRDLDRVYRLAGLLLGNAAEAEDAVGDALERAWVALPRLRDPAGFSAWFDRIVVNACRDRLRRRKRVRFIPIDGSTERATIADPFHAVLERDDVLGRLELLPDEERAVVVLHYWADLTQEAVAERLSVPVGTVKSRLNRALDRMRRAAARGSPEGSR